MSLPLQSRFKIMPLRVSRALGTLAGIALSSPLVIGTIQIIFEPWPHEAWLDIWRPFLVVGLLGSLLLALAAAVAAESRT
jgi:hypothetical protein